jgi:hypothetical protein
MTCIIQCASGAFTYFLRGNHSMKLWEDSKSKEIRFWSSMKIIRIGGARSGSVTSLKSGFNKSIDMVKELSWNFMLY